MLVTAVGGHPPAMCFWPQNTDCLIQEDPDPEDSSPIISLADQDGTVVPTSLQSPSNANPSKDFIRCLPPHLSMYILGLLDQKSLHTCAAVSRCWAFLATEVKRERVCQRVVQENILYLQEKEDNLQAAYHDLQTDTIQLEERNVFCGSYNIRVFTDRSDQSRVIHYGGGNLVAVGSADRKVRLLGMSGMKEVPPLLSGHAGSIKALFLNEKKGFVLSASFDLSIRCWNIYSGACVKIFNGHCGTVTCLDLHEEQFVSGARDGMVKVWNLESGKCLKTLKHNSAVWVVKMDGTRVVSGCDRGLVKVWRADTGALIKTLEGHQGPVKCLSFDQWHLVTGSTDGYALGWSMLGNLKRCLIAFRHPKEVLSLEFLYLRVISGCADGKIRIFNYLTGSCLKVLMANSRGDPISSFYVAENRMVINSPTSLLMFQFEDVRWDYTLATDRERVQLYKTPLQHKKDQTVQLQRARTHSDSLTMKKISIPFETKMLQLKLKNSLHGPTVKSSIPAPSVVRPKTCCGLLREKEAHSGHDPSRSDGGLRLLTGKQREVQEAATAAQHQAHQAKLGEDQQRARKKAWLRKIKGLPIDSFTKEGKIAAPELGLNTFI
ncbi:PREDICTED: F-box/WD repeat-containing protein 10-like [Nipponia nippon]|uniref:F-box/WD repeat-containing protein 10-like n=1 Tax=Nipponia nippon TaxID=128390 RepID=UPI00051148D2|nr:PREDICTED: F-box/WD repeat-containing protein 10-like [Nipponia nippon]